MQNTTVRPCVNHGWNPTIVQRHKALGPSSGFFCHIPVERVGDYQTLRGLQSQCLDIGDEDEETGQTLPAPNDTEFRQLLDRVDGICARIGKSDDLCFRGLRLQQRGGKVTGIKWMLHRANNPATTRNHKRTSITLECMAESVVGTQKEPSITALLDQRLGRPVRQSIGIVRKVKSSRRAELSGEI